MPSGRQANKQNTQENFHQAMSTGESKVSQEKVEHYRRDCSFQKPFLERFSGTVFFFVPR
jgi:hypothetical protein